MLRINYQDILVQPNVSGTVFVNIENERSPQRLRRVARRGGCGGQLPNDVAANCMRDAVNDACTRASTQVSMNEPSFRHGNVID